MNKIVFIPFLLLVLHASSFVHADEQILSRDLEIQREMDCIAQLEKDKLAWGDLCVKNQREYEEPPSKINPTVKPTINPPLQKNHSFSIAHEIFFNKYSKYKKEESMGMWSGLSGAYIYRPPQGNILNNPILNFYSVEGLYAKGKSTRAGMKEPDFLTVKNIPGAMYEARALVGKDLNVSNKIRVTPYVGYGVRYKTTKTHGHEDILSDTRHIWGFKQEQLSYYIPLGLTTNFTIPQDYEVSFNIEYDFFLKGIQKNHYSNANEYASNYQAFPVLFDDIRVTQRGGYGLRSSLKFLKHFSAVDVYVEPFVRYWNIKASKASDGNIKGDPGLSGTIDVLQVQTIKEEKNYTLEGGLKTGILF